MPQRHLGLGLIAAAATTIGWLAPSAAVADCSLTTTGMTPLMDLGTGLYQSFEGGLYAGGSNNPPSGHLAKALETAGQIAAIDGAIVMISVGMSNTTQEFSAFVPLAEGYADKHPDLVVIDGAQGGRAADAWTDPQAQTWDVVDSRLSQASLSPSQVQIAWVKQALPGPSSLGAFPSHAETLEDDLAAIARALLIRYPNIKLAYYSSRTRAYTDDPQTLNPEPFAYESGFSVKWLIEEQISGAAELNYDSANGQVRAPLLLWGPYLWADGSNPRSDGFVWECSDVNNDFTHPSQSGRQKVANLLLDFFTSDATALPWFTNSGSVADAGLADAGQADAGVPDAAQGDGAARPAPDAAGDDAAGAVPDSSAAADAPAGSDAAVMGVDAGGEEGDPAEPEAGGCSCANRGREPLFLVPAGLLAALLFRRRRDA